MRYRRRSEIDFWPVIADTFLGILGVLVFTFVGFNIVNIDADLETFRAALKSTLERDRERGLVVRYDVQPSRVWIVYSADALSFQKCEWELAPAMGEKIRDHLRSEIFRNQEKLIYTLQVEGHADPNPVDGCKNKDKIGPFHDNVQLSQNRARAVYNVLLGLASRDADNLERVLSGQMVVPAPPGLDYVRQLSREGKILVAGYGAARPFVDFRSDPDNAAHRRVEITVQFATK